MPATITLVFSLLVAIVVLATMAARLRLPYAILLVLGGLLLSFLPGLPTITLDPALILFFFLPPLIYSSAWTTSWREFRANAPSDLAALGRSGAGDDDGRGGGGTCCSWGSLGPSLSCWVRWSHQRMPWQPVRPPRVSDSPGV